MCSSDLGSIYDNAEELSVENAQPNYQKHTTRPGDFAMSLLVLTASVMKADNRVLKSELDFVKAFFVRQFGEHYAKEQMLVLREILKQEIPLKDVCEQIKHHIDKPSRLQLLSCAPKAARATPRGGAPPPPPQDPLVGVGAPTPTPRSWGGGGCAQIGRAHV